MNAILLACLLSQGALGQVEAQAPSYSSDLVFAPRQDHNHAPGIVELPDGQLLASWYRGSGERRSDDVAVYGARLPKGGAVWSEAFLLADTPGFPDCNTCLILDPQQRLWLFWPTILANTWESCLTNYRVSSDYLGPGAPQWDRQGLVLLKPADFQEPARAVLDRMVAAYTGPLPQGAEAEIKSLRQKLGDKLYQRLGWQPRCKPTILPSGRMLLPLYSDTFSISIMAITDDGGQTWQASQPLLGFGNIQPTVLRGSDGSLTALMRENGWQKHVRVSRSLDQGLTWGEVGVADLPNPGSGLDGLTLPDGLWLLVYNDTTEGRNSLAVSLSDDEGASWKWTRHLERHPTGAYHYPAVTRSADGTIHAIYSHFTDQGKSMKHAAFNLEWIRQGD